MSINKQFSINEIKFQGEIRTEDPQDSRLTKLFWIHYPLDIQGSHHMSSFQGDLDVFRAEIWEIIISARDRINLEIAKLKNNFNEIEQVKSQVSETFAEVERKVSQRAGEFKAGHSQPESIQLDNELENRLDTLGCKPMIWWDIEEKFPESDQLQEIAKILKSGWESVRKCLE
ncbi:MAG: hypothetical protein K940chlam3_01231 [Chlamydiae bacterium]|nr:hypothetical protein [Chlamydiota bacterium]